MFSRMPSNQRKELTELKRPDLKGRYKCLSCFKVFHHEASLKRHRSTAHSSEHTCLLCNQKLSTNETICDHLVKHGITKKVFTCSCCNWTFFSRVDLSSHVNSIRNIGKPGDTKPLAISCHSPGSLLQSALSGEESVPDTDENKMVDITEEMPKNAKPLTVGDLSECLMTSEGLGKDLSDAITKLSAVKDNAPHIDLYKDAITYIFNKIKFTNEQVTNPIVWHHIIETAVYLNSK